jgi:hypothetical protein
MSEDEQIVDELGQLYMMILNNSLPGSFQLMLSVACVETNPEQSFVLAGMAMATFEDWLAQTEPDSDLHQGVKEHMRLWAEANQDRLLQ